MPRDTQNTSATARFARISKPFNKHLNLDRVRMRCHNARLPDFDFLAIKKGVDNLFRLYVHHDRGAVRGYARDLQA
jgi:hypothetical protein